MTTTAARRLLLVHAHPDDETIGNGATMARYVGEGAHVTLVTCTRGEFGEIMVPELAHLASDREDRLGAYRETELAAAMAALGVTDHRFLGARDEYHDSGMAGLPGVEAPGSFWRADPEIAAARLARVIREIRPQVLVTYDPDGGYGHPDHIKAHRIAMRAVALAGDPTHARGVGEHEPHRVARVYWNAIPESVARADLDVTRAEGASLAAAAGFTLPTGFDHVPGVVDDGAIAACVDGTGVLDRKLAALRAHATQLTVVGGFFALTHRICQRVSAHEYYRLADGEPGSAAGWSGDLFAGLA